MPRTPKPHVIVAIDFGGSLTKVIYQHRRGQPQLLTMSPEATVTTRFAVDKICAFNINPVPPEFLCWVQPLDHEGHPIADEVGAVGDLGAQIAGFNSLNIAKNEKALYKLMGALSVIHQRLNNQGYKLKPDFRVSVQCMLPADEYQLGSRFEKRLQYILSTGVLTPSGVIQPELFSFHCYPEASGVATEFITRHPHIQNAVVFMLGHRNTSAVIIREGRIKQFRTSMLGFNQCLEEACGAHGVTPQKYLDAIFSNHQHRHGDPYAAITPYRDPQQRELAGQDLRYHLRQAQILYVKTLSEWFDNVLMNESSPDLIFCGGGINVITPALNEYQPDLPHHYGSGVKIPADFSTDALTHRLDDIYSLFSSLQNRFKFSAHHSLESSLQKSCA
ncbi:hypothetical protein [Leptolyngbya sp. PCC 6406]|uniref:hypothetical protein n=1 Tax=Leptolyngbya sp. PCC 6406 TaxID=1173264 RepID=UPI0002ABFA15|nr:hypothetical protein [Leptolyngbya sp. PCC 6406]